MVTVTLDVSSSASVGVGGLWVGDVTCSFVTGAGVISGSGRTPVVWDSGTPYSSGGSMTVVANVPAGIQSNLSCTLEQNSGIGGLPNVAVRVTGATGVSINDLTSGYSNFG
jgi:hypothetical protein